MTDNQASGLFVEVVEVSPDGHRQIGPQDRATELLKDRGPEIIAALAEATSIVRKAAEQDKTDTGWGVKSFEVTFSLTIAAEAGVILSKASAEAALEVKVTVERI